MSTKIAIAGAMGRMGQNLIKSGLKNDKTEIVGVFDIENIDKTFLISVGLQSGIATTRENSFEAADVVIDFTSPKALFNFTETAVTNNTGLVIGTTGLEDQHFKLLQQSGQSVPIFYAPNMSFGVNSFFSLARKAAAHLKDFDIEIIEAHHKHKVDAPSGTALMLGEAAADGRGISLTEAADRGRDGIIGARNKGSIGFASIRGGDIVGRHDVLFASNGEQLTLSHNATDRNIFARGALKAVLWGRDKQPGQYDMMDVLGLN